MYEFGKCVERGGWISGARKTRRYAHAASGQKADVGVKESSGRDKDGKDKRKKEKEIKANTSKTVIKEIRFGPNTDEHDFEFKVKHAQKFLEEKARECCSTVTFTDSINVRQVYS